MRTARLLVAMLRDAGHDVLYAAEAASGASDADLLQLARRDGRAILTDDRDFGLLAERGPASAPAVILLRLHPMRRSARARRVTETLASLGDEVRNQLVVIEPGQLRRRTFREPL